MSGKLLESSDGGLTLEGVCHAGKTTITVWWESGRVTHTTYRARMYCHDEIDGDALPWKRWEIRAGGIDAKRHIETDKETR